MSALNNKDFDKDLEFVYDDCDNYANEISELYTYTEEPEFEINLENFEILLKSKGRNSTLNLSNWLFRIFFIKL